MPGIYSPTLSKEGHHQPASKPPFEWHFAEGPMVARLCVLAGMCVTLCWECKFAHAHLSLCRMSVDFLKIHFNFERNIEQVRIHGLKILSWGMWIYPAYQQSSGSKPFANFESRSQKERERDACTRILCFWLGFSEILKHNVLGQSISLVTVASDEDPLYVLSCALASDIRQY